MLPHENEFELSKKMSTSRGLYVDGICQKLNDGIDSVNVEIYIVLEKGRRAAKWESLMSSGPIDYLLKV